MEFGGGLLDQLERIRGKSQLQDSGSDYLSLRSIDLQTSQPANCTLQCESRKLHDVRGEEPQIATVASAGWLSPRTPPPPPSLFFLGEASLVAGSCTGCCPRAALRGGTPGAVLAVFRELAGVPGAPALANRTLSSLASSLGATTNFFKDHPALRWIN